MSQEPQWKDLTRSTTPLTSVVEMDSLTQDLVRPFDYETDGCSEFFQYEVPPELLSEDFNLGVIVGASGTGKTTMLAQFGTHHTPTWGRRSIASHFEDADDANERLSAAGLMSVPEWVKPYRALSNGQRFRADLARSLHDEAVLDEFTSVVDRNVAKAASASMARYIRHNDVQRVVIATCHRDVLEFLEPDWVIDTDKGQYAVGRWLRRPRLVLDVHACDPSLWWRFAPYHYLSESLNKASQCYMALWDGDLVAFASVMTYPSGTVKNAYRLHRLVVHPDYQGLGMGMSLSDGLAEYYHRNGKRFFVKTAHPRLGGYNDNSPLWRPTSKNHMRRNDAVKAEGRTRWDMNKDRWTYSHEYIGEGEE